MPANYHQQIKQMLSGLAARGLQHNDIWKNNLAAARQTAQARGLWHRHPQWQLCLVQRCVPDTLRAHALAPEPYRVSSDAPHHRRPRCPSRRGGGGQTASEAHGAADVRLGVCPLFRSNYSIEELPLIEVRNCTGIPAAAHAKAWQYCGVEQRHRLRKDAPNMMEASPRAHHASLKKWARRS